MTAGGDEVRGGGTEQEGARTPGHGLQCSDWGGEWADYCLVK